MVSRSELTWKHLDIELNGVNYEGSVRGGRCRTTASALRTPISDQHVRRSQRINYICQERLLLQHKRHTNRLQTDEHRRYGADVVFFVHYG